MSSASLEVAGLSAARGHATVLHGVSFKVPAGGALAILGRNGAGKSTLIGAIAGSVPVAAGRVLLDGLDISHLPAHSRTRRGVGLVPQGRHVFPHLTVRENLETGALAGRPGLTPRAVMRIFPRLEALVDRRGGTLSGGEQQQLSIGRALVCNPSLLLLDEPTEGIQPSIVAEIGEALHRVRAEFGTTLVVVEQVVAFAWRLCDRFVALDGGRQALEGATTPAGLEAVLSVLRI